MAINDPIIKHDLVDRLEPGQKPYVMGSGIDMTSPYIKKLLPINREDGGQTPLVQGANGLTAGLRVPPPESTTIKADNLGVNSLQFPTKTEAETPAFPTQLAPTPDEQAATFAQTQAPAPTEAEQTQTGLMARFTSLQEKLFGKAPAQAQAEQAQGIPQKTQAVTDIQAQINQLQNEASAAMIKAQSMGETTSFGNAQIAQIERDRTVKALQLNSFLYAAQGNLATAQTMADKAVKAQFDPIEAEIKYLKEFLDMNEKILTREDKKKADTLKIQLDERTRLLEEQKTERKAIYSVGIEAAEAGADAVLLNKIKDAKTQEEALQIAASDPNLLSWAKTMQEQTRQLAEKQFAENVRQFGETSALARQKFAEDTRQFNEKQKETESLTEVTGNLDAYAQRLASEGKLPSPAELKLAGLTVGEVSERAKVLPKPKGALVSIHTGVMPTNLSATESAGVTAMNEIVNETLPRLEELFPKIYTGILGGIGGLLHTTQNRQDYNTFKQEFLSKLLVARSGAAVTEQEYARYAKLLPGTFNQMLFLGSDGLKKLKSLSKSMKTNLDNTLSTKQLSIYGYTPIKLGNKEYKIGDTIEVNGIQGVILPDGSIAIQ